MLERTPEAALAACLLIFARRGRTIRAEREAAEQQAQKETAEVGKTSAADSAQASEPTTSSDFTADSGSVNATCSNEGGAP